MARLRSKKNFPKRRRPPTDMAIFVTGSTGYLGSYVVAGLLSGYRDKLNLLVRAKTEQEARERLWASLQLHFDFPEFLEHLDSRI
jgi:fengycin family lipopeptide synthetase D